MGNEKKLPQWAQWELERLRATIEHNEAALAAAIGSTKTRVEVNPYASHMGIDHHCFIPENETIRFHFGKHYIDVKIDGGALNVMADDQIEVRPRASNVVWVVATADHD